MFTVYVLYSPSYDEIYIGSSGNVEARILSHNKLATKGWTIRYRPWNLIHTEIFQTKPEALRREKELMIYTYQDHRLFPFLKKGLGEWLSNSHLGRMTFCWSEMA